MTSPPNTDDFAPSAAEHLQAILAALSAATPEVQAQIDAEIEAATGHMKWVPNPGPQSVAYYCRADQTLYGGQAGGGKLQPVDSKVLTPHGWKAIGDLKIGSKVCATDGAVNSVIGVFPQGFVDIYRVTMRDGGSCEAGLDHNWLAWPTHASVKKGNIRCTGKPAARKYTTRQLIDEMESPALSDGRLRRFVVPLPSPVALNVAGGCVGVGNFVGRPIDPYFLGLLIGDGCVSGTTPNITSMDGEIAAYLAVLAQNDLRVSTRDGTQASQFHFRGEFRKRLIASLEYLGLQGKRAGTKAIPRNYLFAPVADRFALLQGLMDTDGWVEEGRACYYTTISTQLADDFEHLVRSLGGITSRTIKHPTYTHNDEKKQGRDAFTIRVKLSNPADAFRITRKKEVASRIEHQSEGRIIESIAFSRRAEAVCIAVSHPNSLYITDDFIVTHNTDILLGLASQEHQRSLILRRLNAEVDYLAERLEEIVGHSVGLNKQKMRWLMPEGRIVQFGGCQLSGDEKKYKGQPKDLIGIDEASEFLESQVDYVIGWLRSTNPKQLCRLVLATNPPTTVAGEWIIRWFAPWLDPRHQMYPYPEGDLLYFKRKPHADGEFDFFVEEPPPEYINGKPIRALTRTFIRSGLRNNPDYDRTDYAARLAMLPKELRLRYEKGDFSASLSDQPMQVIPTEWILAAQERWTPDGGRGTPMTAMAFDPAGGGRDAAVLGWRHGGWYAELISEVSPQTADGSWSAAIIIRHRRDRAPVIVDVGGGAGHGFGGTTIMRLKDNEIVYRAYNGASESNGKTADGHLRFVNKRAQAHWRFREALNPDQPGGSPIALPPDAELRADLAAPTYEVTARGILVEDKKKLRERIGRSPGKGDVVIMAYSEGEVAVKRAAAQSASATQGLQDRADLGGRRLHSDYRKARSGPVDLASSYLDEQS